MIQDIVGQLIINDEDAACVLAGLSLLQPTMPLMRTGHPAIYQAHVAELVKRMLRGCDLTLPTQAEMMLACSAASLNAPFNRAGSTLYRQLFMAVMPQETWHEPVDGDRITRGDRMAADELRFGLSCTLQRGIQKSSVRGLAAVAAWRAAIGRP